ncbi:protein Shroom2 [Bombina bombina]|uniref:protein Shroom2 n=1 Tax=Bombina bombina TaxID=8345 RepID=UPI00235B14C2|nr:protein Shroom2 [Bombina bombina]
MENLETRTGQERLPLEYTRGNQVLVDQPIILERKAMEAYRFVDVLLTGGAPWGFTLKGGKEHGEPLIITKVEDGSKAADILMAGDEIVSISDFPLSGYRQEAICLVKGSHKTLKMIVKRRNDIAYRPHSWHSTKYIESPLETVTSHCANSDAASWNSRYHSSSSPHELSNPWDQINLQRNSGHFSSMGSMDSIDQTCQYEKLSSAKSNNSTEHLGNQNKRDSAYGSLSTSFINPDYASSKTGSASTENILSKINQWDNTNLRHGKSNQFLNETKGSEDKQGYLSPSVLSEMNRSSRSDEYVESRPSSRSNFGPIWYVPDKKKTESSPPPPPPPIRSDSFAFTKGHEKPTGPAHSENSSTQHFTVANRPQPRPDWSSESSDYQQKLVRVTDRNLSDVRRVSNSPYHGDIILDPGLSTYNDSYNDPALNSTRLQFSLSSNDIRFAQPTYNYHHQRQYSDESTLFQSTRSTLHKPHQQMAFYTGVHELSADPPCIYYSPKVSSSSSDNIGLRHKVETTVQNHVYSGKSKQTPQVTNSHPFKEYCRTEANLDKISKQHENAVSYTKKSSYNLIPQNIMSSLENCEKKSSRITEKGDVRNVSKKNDYFEEQYEKHNFGQQENSDKNVLPGRYRPHKTDYRWDENERNKITPQITPMLHSLSQEGRNRSDSFPASENEKFPFTDPKHTRRSDRFATALRNEIQQKRAHLQKSKSTAALTESVESENSEIWNQNSVESMASPSDGSFSNTYKSHLQEAQARVLRATSFKRRDLEPGMSDQPPLSGQYSNMSMSVSPLHGDSSQPKQTSVVNNSQNITRIGGRKRFTAQQKLKSYSEPEKMNEVGIYEDHQHSFSSNTSQEAVGSFADRWKFFEETSKCKQLINAPKHAPTNLSVEKYEAHSQKDNDNEPGESWHDKGTRAASLGLECLPDQNRGPNIGVHNAIYPVVHNVIQDQPQRLGTFAEYQASWKEQKKTLERKNSGRCHSADNILDAGLEQSSKTQYVHVRSRSSPTTDFYTQGAIASSKNQAENPREDSYIPCSNERGDSSIRIVQVASSPCEEEDTDYSNKWKSPVKSSPVKEKSPEESRTRSGTLPSDYRYVQENVIQGKRDISFSAVPISESCSESKNWCYAGEDGQSQEQTSVNKKRGPAPQRPPPPKLDKYRKQNSSTSSLATSSESLVTNQGKNSQSLSSSNLDVNILQPVKAQSPALYSDKHLQAPLHDPRLSLPPENENHHLDKKHIHSDSVVYSKSFCLQKPGMEPSRSPSPQFAPQKLTDKPPVLVQDENLSRIERIIDNTTVKMVPIKIVHSESHEEKESRHNLLNAIEPPALPTGLAKDQLKTLSTSEQSYSLFCAYTRHDPDPEEQSRMFDSQVGAENINENDVSTASNSKSKDKVYDDLKSEELMREIVGKDKSLAEILDPSAKFRTTMDLMEGIFPKDENLLEEAQQRRKLLPKVPSPRPTEEKKDEQNMPLVTPLTTSSTYYSTSAPKAELLIKMKDMQEQQHPQENSEDELDHNLSEKKQELIDSISRKLQVLRDARETLLEDIQCNNALGEEVEVIVKEVCKPNEFDKFRMFVGDLEKIVNLLLSLSGRLARVENALNNLDETVSPEERRTLVEKRKLLTRQHEDAKELKENLDRRERIVFDILASYLNEENLADYEHFVKMKSALILEQRELEDKIKLGEEQLKCLTESLPTDRTK